MTAAYYHVSPKSNRTSILAHGLDRNRTSILAHGLDRSRGEALYDGITYPPGIYLFRGRDGDAYAYKAIREEWELDEFGAAEAESFDVWAVHDEPPVDRDPFCDDESGLGEHAFYPTAVISSERLRLLTD